MSTVTPLFPEAGEEVFTLDDLEAKLSTIYTRTINFAQYHKAFLTDNMAADEQVINEGLKETNSILQELLAIVTKHKNDFESINPLIPTTETEQVIVKAVGEEKIQFYVAGVQLIEDGIMKGTSLYSKMPKAKAIRDILNKRFAELGVKHEARIQQYPVF